MRNVWVATSLLCLIQAYAGSVSSNETLPDGIKAISYIQAGDTTLEKQKRAEAARDKEYLFRGSIVDVRTEIDLRVNLGAGMNNLQVILEEKDGSALPVLRKNQVIKFRGKLDAIARYKRPIIEDANIIAK